MKKLFTLIALLACVVSGAWAWSVRLSSSYEVIGYKYKALYNFDSDANAIALVPTTGDFRYRNETGKKGWMNYKNGNRGANIDIPVAKDDIIIFDLQDPQGKGKTVNSVTNGTLNASLSGTFPTFSISADASSINVNIGNYMVIVSILVMEKDQSAATADYTINYKMGETTVKTVNGNTPIGNTVNADASFVEGGVKYISTSSTLSMTIASGTNTLNVDVRQAASYNYTVVAKDGETTMATLANGSSLEGDNVTVGYPEYMLIDGTLFSSPRGGDWYRRTFTPNADNYIENIAFTNAGISNVVFYTEAELIAGTSAGANTARASRGQMGYTGNSESYIDATTLAPGKYQIYARGVNGNTAVRTANFKVGDDVVWAFSIPTAIDARGNSEEFTVSAESTLQFACDGSSQSGCDWFYIVKTGDIPATVPVTISAAGYATFVTPYPVDFTDNAIEAYAVSAVNANTVTLKKVTEVPADEAVIVKGESGNVNVIASAKAITNELKVATEAIEFDKNADNINYVLAQVNGNVGLYPVNEGTIAAGKGYLPVAKNNAAKGGFTFVTDNVTAVEMAEAAPAAVKNGKFATAEGIVIVKDGVKYNVAGMKK